MSLPVPNLDDRQFAALVERARMQIPLFAPGEWTDHNAHDPGITFLELFAWLAEMQIYYLNRVPDKHELKFLRLLGFAPRPAVPAKADVTFALLDSASNVLIPQKIPQKTQFAAPKFSIDEKIVFETDVELQALPLLLAQVITSDQFGIHDNTQMNDEEGMFYSAFGESAQKDSILYLGLEFLTSPPIDCLLTSPPETLRPTLMVSLYEKDLPARGAHGDEWIAKANNSPAQSEQSGEELKFFPSASVVWEYWNDNKQWEEKWPDGTPLLQKDGTRAFSWSGNLTFNLPPDHARRQIPPLGNDFHWLRCKLVQPGYEIAPRIESIRINTIPVTQGVTVEDETLGSSIQLPNQVFKFRHSPVLSGSQTIEVQEADGLWKEWREVPDFDPSGPDDEHYLVRCMAGEVQFGDGINGRIPPSAADKKGNIKAAIYRYGGGGSGNVAAETIQIVSDDKLRKDVTVINRQSAAGGTEEEKLLETRRRALRDLRTPYQAVSSIDYEFLARHTPGLRVARAKALPLLEPPDFTKRNGLVTVAVVPFSFSPKPFPSAGFLRTVCEHLDHHRLITTEVRVIPPDYVTVSVNATVLLKPRVSSSAVQKGIEGALSKFLDPLKGGVGGSGWEFGRSVYQSEIYQLIEGVSGVDCVMQVTLAAQGNFQFDGNNVKLIRPHVLVCSGRHRLELIDPEQRCEIKGPCHEPKKQR
jgi:predicted phage baseplate assembly protein